MNSALNPADPARSPIMPLAHGEGALKRVCQGWHGDPFSVLGIHRANDLLVLTVFMASATGIEVEQGGARMSLAAVLNCDGIFQGIVPNREAYELICFGSGHRWHLDDPYRFGPVIGELDEYLLGEGTHRRLWQALGAHPLEHEGVWGTSFAVWAPNARRVSVVGPFNNWDGRRNPMRLRGSTGVWEIFLPDIHEGEIYKYEILAENGAVLPLKADPVGFGSEHPPETASVVRDISGYGWRDQDWLEGRHERNNRHAPISIYEVHLGSWKRMHGDDARPISYREAAQELVEYVADMGFTHIELLPVSEYPFDGSWGYQPVGLFAPTIRFGPPHEFRDLIDAAHLKGIGVLLDWVPGHFPADAHGLAQFDGTHLYEHADPREGFHQDWNTLIYNFGRREVRNYLVSNALYWLEEYHLDGLRVDAVASMLYRDYSRKQGEWVPNRHGGRENLEAIDLLKEANTTVYEAAPGIMTVAEESTSFPRVSHPVHADGLGFGFKWNMGWMNDVLDYFTRDPVHRKHHHNQLTFGLTYAFSENFVLPISHDEVVHGKKSLLEKMPGDRMQKFANLRAFLGLMWGQPGKKLLFMGCEFGQPREWDHDTQIDWPALSDPAHAGVQNLVRDLNQLYRNSPALHWLDCEPGGFAWIDADNDEQSVLSWLRFGAEGDPPIAVICNLTPVQRDIKIGLPLSGRWSEVLNSDAQHYGGSGIGNKGGVDASEEGANGQPHSAHVTLPGLSTIYLRNGGACREGREQGGRPS